MCVVLATEVLGFVCYISVVEPILTNTYPSYLCYDFSHKLITGDAMATLFLVKKHFHSLCFCQDKCVWRDFTIML